MKRRLLIASLRVFFLALSLSLPVFPARAHENEPEPVSGVEFEQNLDAQLPLDTILRDESGREVRLGKFFGSKPILLVFAYYDCPMLCTLVLNDLTQGLQGLPFGVGQEFEVITVSIDPGEGPDLAAQKKETYLEELDQPGAEKGWHFLTADQPAITALTSAAGFRYVYVEEKDEYAHPTGVLILTPEGRVSRYILGIDYPATDLRLGLVEAAGRKIGSPVDQIYLLCYDYDPVAGRYTLLTHRLLQFGGALTVVGLAVMIRVLSKTDNPLARRDKAREPESINLE